MPLCDLLIWVLIYFRGYFVMEYSNFLFGSDLPSFPYPWVLLASYQSQCDFSLQVTLIKCASKIKYVDAFVMLLLWLIIILNTSLKILWMRVLINIRGGIKYPNSQLMSQIVALHYCILHHHCRKLNTSLKWWIYMIFSDVCWPALILVNPQIFHSGTAALKDKLHPTKYIVTNPRKGYVFNWRW